ncbi:MAG: DUF1934 domain-containing protein [Ruminococcus sp.]|nr:DUF1934 domain-containing protein [Ruminococcus sp.]
MTRDVIVRISGLHQDAMEDLPDEENVPIEVMSPGSYYWRNGKHYVIYDEVTEGIPGVTKNEIKITGDNSLEIIKRGAANSHMIFEKNKKSQTYYQTPYGQMLVGIHTRDMEVNVSEQKIDVSVDYELDVNYEPLADCKIRMNILSRSNGEFSLCI